MPLWILNITAWLIVGVGAIVIATSLLFIVWCCFDYWWRQAKLAVTLWQFLSWRRKERRKKETTDDGEEDRA